MGIAGNPIIESGDAFFGRNSGVPVEQFLCFADVGDEDALVAGLSMCQNNLQRFIVKVKPC